MKCLVLLVLMINLVLAKQYERCQLAEELYYKHNVTLKEIGMLVCFAETRSNLDTESLDNGNYGLLKFNSRAWCSITDEVGGNCNVKCDDFIDDDITDDIKCAKQIILAEGLDAWGLTTECQETSERIIEDCIHPLNTEDPPRQSSTYKYESTTNYYVYEPKTNSYAYELTTEKTETNEKITAKKIVDLVMGKFTVNAPEDAETLTTERRPEQENQGNVIKSNNQMTQPRINNFFMFNFNFKETK